MRRAAAAAGLVVLFLLGMVAAPAPAGAAIDVCDAVGSLPILGTSCNAREGAEIIGGAAGGVIGGAIEREATDRLGGLAASIVDGAVAMIGYLTGAIIDTGRPDLGAAWFLGQYGLVRVYSLGLVALATVLGMGVALVKQDAGELRLVWAAAGAAIIRGQILISLVQVAIDLSWGTGDVFAGWFGQASVDALNRIGLGLQELVSGPASNAALAGLVFFVGLVVIFCAGVGWFWLVFGIAGIHIAVALFPLVDSMSPWQPAAGGARKLGRIIAGLVLAPPIVMLALAVAMGLLGGGGPGGGAGDTFTAAVAGTIGLGLATFSPPAILAFVSSIGTSGFVGGGRGTSRARQKAAHHVRDRVRKHRGGAGAGDPAPVTGPGDAAAPPPRRRRRNPHRPRPTPTGARP